MTPDTTMPTRPFKQRVRCGSWNCFEQRFAPLPAPDHDLLWEIGQVPETADYRYWWTVLDCEGRLYLSPGFRFVNRFAFVRCAAMDRRRSTAA